MKRKKIITGRHSGAEVKITIEITSDYRLMRDESQRLMDCTADGVMRLFPDLPYMKLPLVRLMVR